MMKVWQVLGSSATAVVFSTAAFADVTPEEVWQNWQDLSTSYGQTLTTKSAERAGDALVIKGLGIAYEQDGMAVDATLEEVVFTDNGDGTVTVTMSEIYPMNMTIPAIEFDPTSLPSLIAVTLTQSGLEMIASGTAAAMNYDFSAPSMKLAFTATDTAETPKTNGTGDFNLSGVSGKYKVSGEGAAKTLDSEFNVEALAASVAMTDPLDETKAEFTATMADFAVKSLGNFAGMDEADFFKSLAMGFTSSATINTGATTYDVSVTDTTGQTKLNGAADSGSFNFSFDKTMMKYGGDTKMFTMTVSAPNIPVPEVSLAYSEALFNFELPIGKTTEPMNFSIVSKLIDVTTSDEIWALFDPEALLPRDPATVIIDATGTAKVTTDLMDPATMDTTTMDTAGDAMPAELYSLDIKEIRASLAGAELTGSGAFTFDNSDLTTFDGMPLPTGKLDLKLVGGNTLMDKLTTIGLIAAEEVMSMRMMLSMFANPGPGEDELNSSLEFKDGGFFANGQQLQ